MPATSTEMEELSRRRVGTAGRFLVWHRDGGQGVCAWSSQLCSSTRHPLFSKTKIKRLTISQCKRKRRYNQHACCTDVKSSEGRAPEREGKSHTAFTLQLIQPEASRRSEGKSPCMQCRTESFSFSEVKVFQLSGFPDPLGWTLPGWDASSECLQRRPKRLFYSDPPPHPHPIRHPAVLVSIRVRLRLCWGHFDDGLVNFTSRPFNSHLLQNPRTFIST